MLTKISKLSYSNTIVFLLIYLLIWFIQYNSLEVGVLLFFIFGIGLTFYDKSKGYIFYIISVFIFDDYPYDLSLSNSFVSVDSLTIAGQTLSKIWSLFIFLVIGLDLIKVNYSLSKDPLRRNLSIVFLFSIITGILNGGLYYLGPFINDLRFFINFFIGYLGVILYLKKNNHIYNLFRLFSVIFIGKLIVLIFSSVINSTSSSFFLITGDSGFIFAPTILILYYILSKKKSSFLIYAAIFLCLLSFGVSVSRGKILLLLIQTLTFLFLIGRLRYIPVYIIIFLSLITYLLPVINEGLYNALVWKLTSFKPDRATGHSSLVRYVEYKNIIWQNLNSAQEFVFGQGLGGSWNSKFEGYGFSLYDTDSYPDEWIKNDKFFKPHGVIQFIILKFGFGGFILIYGSLIHSLFSIKKLFKKMMVKDSINQQKLFLMVLLFSSVCSLFIISYSSKHQLFLGLFLASFSHIKSSLYKSIIKPNENIILINSLVENGN